MEITTDKILAELAKIGFSNLTDFATWDNAEVRLRKSSELGDNGGVISEVSQGKDGVKIKLWDKLNALEKIAKHIGMYTKEEGEKATYQPPSVTINLPNGGIFTNTKPESSGDHSE